MYYTLKLKIKTEYIALISKNVFILCLQISTESYMKGENNQYVLLF